MIDSVHVPTVIDDPMDFTVIATNPAQMERSQKSLILWVARKLQAEKELEADTKEQFEIALRNKWKKEPWKRRLTACGERLVFYRKIKAALEAGYYIVPPFPMDVFAVRTNKDNPPWQHSRIQNKVTERAMMLPEGDGEYVNVHPSLQEHTVYKTDPLTHITDYNKIDYKWFSAGRHAQVDFPFKLVKPIVMQETAKAMALKIFDQLGVLPAVPTQGQVVQRDPMICGQILGRKHVITFFIAWWLDTKAI
jgi:hypothetical protein